MNLSLKPVKAFFSRTLVKWGIKSESALDRVAVEGEQDALRGAKGAERTAMRSGETAIARGLDKTLNAEERALLNPVAKAAETTEKAAPKVTESAAKSTQGKWARMPWNKSPDQKYLEGIYNEGLLTRTQALRWKQRLLTEGHKVIDELEDAVKGVKPEAKMPLAKKALLWFVGFDAAVAGVWASVTKVAPAVVPLVVAAKADAAIVNSSEISQSEVRKGEDGKFHIWRKGPDGKMVDIYNTTDKKQADAINKELDGHEKSTAKGVVSLIKAAPFVAAAVGLILLIDGLWFGRGDKDSKLVKLASAIAEKFGLKDLVGTFTEIAEPALGGGLILAAIGSKFGFNGQLDKLADTLSKNSSLSPEAQVAYNRLQAAAPSTAEKAPKTEVAAVPKIPKKDTATRQSEDMARVTTTVPAPEVDNVGGALQHATAK